MKFRTSHLLFWATAKNLIYKLCPFIERGLAPLSGVNPKWLGIFTHHAVILSDSLPSTAYRHKLAGWKSSWLYTRHSEHNEESRKRKDNGFFIRLCPIQNYATKKCYIYNIMSYPTFWHQKNQKNPTPQLRYPFIFSQKFTTIVNFTISVKNRHLFSKIHYFTESVKKFAFIFFWIILRKIHYFIE